MSALKKLLLKEKSFDLLMEEKPRHEPKLDWAEAVDVLYEPEVPDRHYTYHVREWVHSVPTGHTKCKHPEHLPIIEEVDGVQVVKKLPTKKWSENSFDEELYKTINFQYP